MARKKSNKNKNKEVIKNAGDHKKYGFTEAEAALLNHCTTKVEYNKRKKETSLNRKQQSDKQRKLDNLTPKQRKIFNRLRAEMVQFILDNKVNNNNNKKQTEKITKDSARKGKNANKGVQGIFSEKYLNDVIGTSSSFLKHCIKNNNITQLRQIKSSMAASFIEKGIFDKGWAYTTTGTYMGHLKKLGESCYTKMNNFKKIITEPTIKMYKDTKPDGTMLENRSRGRKADGSTYTIREARIITRHLEKEFGPMGRALGSMMMEGGFRSEEIRKMKWKDIETEVKKIDLTRKNVTKNSRPRIVTNVSEETIKLLSDIKGFLGVTNDEERVFGRLFPSVKAVNNALERACKSGKVAYLGAHAMRSVSKEFQMKQLQTIKKDIIKDYGMKNGEKEYRKWLVVEVMKHVTADPSLNPIGKDGKPKYTYEKLMRYSKLEWLEKLKISQSFGHGRTSVTRAYGAYISRAAAAAAKKQ